MPASESRFVLTAICENTAPMLYRMDALSYAHAVCVVAGRFGCSVSVHAKLTRSPASVDGNLSRASVICA